VVDVGRRHSFAYLGGHAVEQRRVYGGAGAYALDLFGRAQYSHRRQFAARAAQPFDVLGRRRGYVFAGFHAANIIRVSENCIVGFHYIYPMKMHDSVFVAPPRLERLPPECSLFSEIAADSSVEDVESCRFSRETVVHFEPRPLTVDGCVFDRVRMPGLRMRGAKFCDVRFESCDLSMVDLHGASLNRVEFAGCKLQGADMSETVMNHVSFAGISARYANLSMSRLRNVRFDGADMRSGVLSDIRQELACVRRCDFTECDFSHTRLAGLDFGDSAIDGISVNAADLRGVAVSTWQAAGLIRILGVIVRD